MVTVGELLSPPDPRDGAGVPRNHNGWPMIRPLPGEGHLAYKSGVNAGLVPYFRSSYYGGEIEDKHALVAWQKRQVARGVFLGFQRGTLRNGPNGGAPYNPEIEPGESREKKAWDAVAERAEEEVGSYRWAKLGTAIHHATELVDLGGDLSDLSPEVRERADAYWQARKRWGWTPTSVETFGVEDTNHVAGTWDRTMWFCGRHTIGDVKTSGSMDFAGIGFAVQLAEYSRMREYDPETGERRDREIPVDLEVGWIIHVDRNPGGPVELHRVDIAEGWRFASLVAQVLEARSVGRKAIGKHLDPDLATLTRCTTRAQLTEVMSTNPISPEMREVANEMWRLLR